MHRHWVVWCADSFTDCGVLVMYSLVSSQKMLSRLSVWVGIGGNHVCCTVRQLANWSQGIWCWPEVSSFWTSCTPADINLLITYENEALISLVHNEDSLQGIWLNVDQFCRQQRPWNWNVIAQRKLSHSRNLSLEKVKGTVEIKASGCETLIIWQRFWEHCQMKNWTLSVSYLSDILDGFPIPSSPNVRLCEVTGLFFKLLWLGSVWTPL